MKNFEEFTKYELDENDYLILSEIERNVEETKKNIVIGFRITPTGYVLEKDSANLVEYITNNTIYKTQKKALDILRVLQNSTPYFRYIGTLNNGGPSDMCLSPVGVLKLFEHEQIEVIHYILKGLYFVYNREPEIKITTLKNRPHTILFSEFYKQLFINNEIPFEVFRNIFYGLKELGYIEGTGGIETLEGNDLKLTGLGVKYIEELLRETSSSKEQEVAEQKEENKQEQEQEQEQEQTAEENTENKEDGEQWLKQERYLNFR